MNTEQRFWVALNMTAGIGPVRMRQLLERFGSAQQAWQAPPGELATCGLEQRTLNELLARREALDLEATCAAIDKSGVQVLTWKDENYPAHLKAVDDSPPLLYLRGELKPADNWSVAVVGTRKATSYGREVTRELCEALVRAGVTIVSGLARGIDEVAHSTALAELARLLGDQDELVTMYLLAAKGQVYFQLRDTVLVAQLLEGNYPDYAQLIPRSHTTRAVMTTSELRAACRAADIFARESSFSVRVSVKPGSELKPGNVELDARSAETGSNEVQVSATVEGAALDIAFNVKYLADVLNVISSESVALELSGSNAPGVVRPLGNDDFLSVIMPMHLGG